MYIYLFQALVFDVEIPFNKANLAPNCFLKRLQALGACSYVI